ncbi:MAG: YggS family pyridoxal phosphate-dependent enzyme [Gammaproteobacteria bacterium]|nr:YggS family pyridoxal phosphate-dependent enzyme [Gammaproteobacteria bacterium]
MTQSIASPNDRSSLIEDRYSSVLEALKRCAVRARRNPNDIGLLAVSKTRTIDEIRTLASFGQVDFGENYVVDALPKIRELVPLGLTWHFVGTVQSNKTKLIAQHFDWVHSIDRTSVARRLNESRHNEPLNVCIQVNVDDEPQKSGIRKAEAADLVENIQELPRLRLRGLMSIPKVDSDPEVSRTAFSTLYELFHELRPSVSEYWDTLSMGMTSDYEVAIQEGATLVRLGTALFGPRA